MANETPSFVKLILFSTLATSVLCAVYIHHDAYKLEHDLKSQVQALISDLISESSDYEVDATATVTASRKFILFGQPKGKITIYLRNNQIEDMDQNTLASIEANESHEKKYSGIEYIFQKDEKEWLNTESGICSEKFCQINAQQAFAAMGD